MAFASLQQKAIVFVVPLISRKCSDVVRSSRGSSNRSFPEFCIQLDVKGRRKNGLEYVLIVMIHFSQQLACYSKLLYRTWYWNGILANDFISFHWKLICLSAFHYGVSFAFQISKIAGFPFKTNFLYRYICFCVLITLPVSASEDMGRGRILVPRRLL